VRQVGHLLNLKIWGFLNDFISVPVANAAVLRLYSEELYAYSTINHGASRHYRIHMYYLY